MTHTESRAEPLPGALLPAILPDPLTPQERALADAEYRVRAQRLGRMEQLAYRHYDPGHERVVQGCEECWQLGVAYVVYGLASPWRKRLDPLRGFRR